MIMPTRCSAAELPMRSALWRKKGGGEQSWTTASLAEARLQGGRGEKERGAAKKKERKDDSRTKNKKEGELNKEKQKEGIRLGRDVWCRARRDRCFDVRPALNWKPPKHRVLSLQHQKADTAASCPLHGPCASQATALFPCGCHFVEILAISSYTSDKSISPPQQANCVCDSRAWKSSIDAALHHCVPALGLVCDSVTSSKAHSPTLSSSASPPRSRAPFPLRNTNCQHVGCPFRMLRRESSKHCIIQMLLPWAKRGIS